MASVSTYVDAGNFLFGRVGRQVRLLHISVDMVAVRGHKGVVEVAGVMPYAVFLIHAYMAHLHGQEIFQHGLPYATLIDVVADVEHRR